MNLGDVFGISCTKNNLGSSTEKDRNNEDWINIQDTVDPHARYKMPKLKSRIKDKGKFAETFISNLPELAQALKVKAPALIKFMESMLGSQFLLAEKRDLSSYYIKGRFDYESLYTTLRSFISQYVLCEKCNLPELGYLIEKKKYMNCCKSCGYSQTVDPSHRIYKLLF